MYRGPKQTIFRCQMICPAWVERAQVNAMYCAWQAGWVRGVEYSGPPSGTIGVLAHFRPNMFTSPLKFIIPSICLACALSTNCFGLITMAHWSGCNRDCGLASNDYSCARDCGCTRDCGALSIVKARDAQRASPSLRPATATAAFEA